MAVQSPKCPNCGSPVLAGETSCKYCQASIVFSPDLQEVRLVGFSCPKCGNTNDKGVSFCARCGTQLIIKCSSCRHDMPLDASICPNCRASRAAKTLIGEADSKRKVVTDRAEAETAEIQRQVDEHPEFKIVAERLAGTATQLEAEATGLSSTRSRYILFSVLSLVLGFVVGMLLSLVINLMLGGIAYVASSGKSGDIGGMGCCVMVFFFLASMVVVGYWAFKAISVHSKMQSLLREAVERRGALAWRKYATDDENRVIQSVFKWGEDQTAAIASRKDADLAEIDKWLEDSLNSLK